MTALTNGETSSLMTTIPDSLLRQREEVRAALEEEITAIRQTEAYERTNLSDEQYVALLQKIQKGEILELPMPLCDLNLDESAVEGVCQSWHHVRQAQKHYFDWSMLARGQNVFAWPVKLKLKIYASREDVTVEMLKGIRAGLTGKRTNGEALAWGCMLGFKLAKEDAVLESMEAQEDVLRVFRNTIVQTVVEIDLAKNEFGTLFAAIQNKESSKTLGDIEGHNDWDFIKEVMLTKLKIKFQNLPSANTDIAKFFRGEMRLETGQEFTFIERKEKLSAQKVGSFETVWSLVTSERLCIKTGDGKVHHPFVALVDNAVQEFGDDVIFCDYNKFLILARKCGSDPELAYFCATQYIVERRGGAKEKEYSRPKLENEKIPYWALIQQALRDLATHFNQLLTYAEVKNWQSDTWQLYVSTFKEPNILKQFLSLQAYEKVFTHHESPLGPMGDNSWICKVPGSVQKSLEFAKDLLVQETFKQTLKNAVANGTDPKDVLTYGALKTQFDEIKDAIRLDRFGEVVNAEAQAKLAEEKRLAEEEEKKKALSRVETPETKAKRVLDDEVAEVIRRKVRIFEMNSTQDAKKALNETEHWRCAGKTDSDVRLWLSTPRLSNDFETVVIAYERNGHHNKRLSKAPFSLTPTMNADRFKKFCEHFATDAGTKDILMMFDGGCKLQENSMQRAFPLSARQYKTRDEMCVVVSEKDMRERRTYLAQAGLKMRENILRIRMEPMPPTVVSRKHLPNGGTSASDTFYNVPLPSMSHIPRMPQALKKRIFKNLTTFQRKSVEEETEGEAPADDMMVIALHHEVHPSFAMQVIEENGAAKGAIFHHNPSANWMLAAMRSENCFYFGAALNSAHKEYLLNVARKEVESAMETRYASSSLKLRLSANGCTIDQFYPQAVKTKRQRSLDETLKKQAADDDGADDGLDADSKKDQDGAEDADESDSEPAKKKSKKKKH